MRGPHASRDWLIRCRNSLTPDALPGSGYRDSLCRAAAIPLQTFCRYYRVFFSDVLLQTDFWASLLPGPSCRFDDFKAFQHSGITCLLGPIPSCPWPLQGLTPLPGRTPLPAPATLALGRPVAGTNWTSAVCSPCRSVCELDLAICPNLYPPGFNPPGNSPVASSFAASSESPAPF